MWRSTTGRMRVLKNLLPVATIPQVQERVRTLNNKEAVYGVLFEVVRRFEAYLVDLNLIQLEAGKNPEGQLLGTYARSTELEALFGDGPRPIQPKVEGQPYNFQWTGGLFDGFTLQIDNDSATFTSTDPKVPLLTEKYGNLFGLSQEHLQEAVRDKLYPAFAEEIRKRLLV